MSHRVYQMTNGKMRTGLAPGGVFMGLGATDHNGRDLPMIVAIDLRANLYRREGGEWQEFPSQVYILSQIVWDAEHE